MIDPNLSNSYYNYPLLIKQLLFSPLAWNPQQEIVSGLNKKYNYKGFLNRINSLANALKSIGVKKGNTIGVMDWDCHRYLECFFAIPMMGAVLHTINIRLSEQQILYTINHAEDDILLVHQDFIPIINKIYSQFDRTIKIVLLNDSSMEIKDIFFQNYVSNYEDLLKKNESSFEFEDFDEHTIATKFYTTGTTGKPKGVSYSHRQLVIHTLGFIAGTSISKSEHRFHNEDVYMPLTPMFHVHAWGFPYMATLLGVKQVYPGKFEPSLLLELIKNEKVTFSHCVPTILQLLISENKKKEIDLSGLKLIIGGSAMPKSLALEATRLGINVLSAYGMSETCPFLTIAQIPSESNNIDEKILIDSKCKTGKPGPLVELRVVDEKLNDIPKDNKTTGEVVVRAPWLTSGYIKDKDASIELWKGGYMHTGDVGYIDETGSLVITDRIKDVIKSGGEWISSLQIEDIVSQCEEVKEVAAIGVPDEKWGERPILIISTDNTVHKTEIISNVQKKINEQIELGFISKWAMPDRVVFVNEIDKTSVGKINKKLLREKFNIMKN